MAKQARERAQILDVQAATPIGGSLAANDTMLTGLWLSAALVGTLTIAGFEKASDGTAASYVLPIGLPTGNHNLGGMINAKGQLTMALSSASDVNKVIVRSQPIGQLMT